MIVFLSLHREASVLRKPESPHLPAASTLNQHLVVGGWSISCFAVLLEQQFQPFPTEAAEGIEGFFWLTLADYHPSCWGNAGGRGSRQMAMLCWEQWGPTCRILTVLARTPAHGVCCPQLRWASMPFPNLGNPTGNPRGMSCSWFCQDDNILYIYTFARMIITIRKYEGLAAAHLHGQLDSERWNTRQILLPRPFRAKCVVGIETKSPFVHHESPWNTCYISIFQYPGENPNSLTIAYFKEQKWPRMDGLPALKSRNGLKSWISN